VDFGNRGMQRAQTTVHVHLLVLERAQPAKKIRMAPPATLLQFVAAGQVKVLKN
jgi:hypothetical protein